MEPQRVILSKDLQQSLTEAIACCPHDRLFVLTDNTTLRCCWPVIKDYPCVDGASIITIPASDQHKDLESVSHVWQELQRGGATRHSLMMNLGGGMVTDLGGFAASTFKRGIAFINIPTTLLAMVDASVGGKTGFNFGGLKNEIGVFNNASSVILDTIFLQTLDKENLLSGYAEMLKHALISNETLWAEHLEALDNLENLGNLEWLGRLVSDSIAVKQRIVLEDPTEKGLRKALNLGHTAGHAFEALALEGHTDLTDLTDLSPLTPHHSPLTTHHSPLLHGYAVAYGLVVELYLSAVKCGFPTDKMRQTVQFIKEYYGRMAISCDDYPHLLELMHHDKKNEGDSINFTLLGGIGDIRINQTVSEEDIKEALDFYREY